MARFCVLFVFHLITQFSLYGQEKSKFLVVEAGVDFIDNELLIDSRIRKIDPSYFQDLTSSDGIRNTLSRVYGGVKVEFRTRNNMVGFLTGLKYSSNISQIERAGYPYFFYFLYQQTGTTTDYLKVERLEQISNYVGIPFEAKFFAYGERTVRLYFSAGADVNFSVRKKNNVYFRDPAMNKYSEEVSDIVGTAGRFYASFYARAGLTFGKKDPSFGLALTVPTAVSNSVSTLLKPEAGGGINVQLSKRF